MIKDNILKETRKIVSNNNDYCERCDKDIIFGENKHIFCGIEVCKACAIKIIDCILNN